MVSRTVENVETRDTLVVPGFNYGAQLFQDDTYLYAPHGYLDGIQKFLQTCRALSSGSEDNDILSHNDLVYAWRGLRADLPNQTSNDLTFLDGTTLRAGDGEGAQAGTYKAAVAATGNLVNAGGILKNTADPTMIGFATAAAYTDPVAVAALFVTDSGDSNAVGGVYCRGTAATDHIRAELRNNNDVVALVDRTSSSDTDDDTSTYTLTDGTLHHYAIGLKYSNDDTLVVVNGDIVDSDDASANAQALTGNIVGIYMGGASPRLGLVAFRAFVP